MLILLSRTKMRRYRLRNLSLLDTLTFLCIPQARAKDILRLIRLGGPVGGLSRAMTSRIEERLLNSTPGLLEAGVGVGGGRLIMRLIWPDFTATLAVRLIGGVALVNLDLAGYGEDVMEMARDAAALKKTA